MGSKAMELMKGREELARQPYFEMRPTYDYNQYKLVKPAKGDNSVELSLKRQNGHSRNGNGHVVVPVDTLYLDYFTLRVIIADSQATRIKAPEEFKLLGEQIGVKARSQLDALEKIIRCVSPGLRTRFLDYSPKTLHQTN